MVCRAMERAAEPHIAPKGWFVPVLSRLYRSVGMRLGERASADHDEMVATGEVVVGVLPQNIDKNRYSNICPADAQRVVLRRHCEPDDETTDYINASHVKAPSVTAIASQGPTHPEWHGPDTTGDFWAAVWEQAVEVIVGLAKVQRGFSGSARYWPEAVGSTVPARGWPELTVTLLAEDAGPHFTTRRLQLVHTPPGGGADASTTREVTQLHYDRWPNYGVPDNAVDMAMLLRCVEEIEARRLASPAGASPAPPLWVHCSGGVGRTAVFLSALSALRSVFPTAAAGSVPQVAPGKDPEALAESVAATVASLRQQRHPWMVEGEAQFVFAHAMLMHELHAKALAMGAVHDKDGGSL